jgi:hypothetical protein
MIYHDKNGIYEIPDAVEDLENWGKRPKDNGTLWKNYGYDTGRGEPDFSRPKAKKYPFPNYITIRKTPINVSSSV